MPANRFSCWSIAVLIAASVTATAIAAAPHGRVPTQPQAVASTSGRVVDYASLETQVGAVLVIDTTLNTTRRGTLIKYTNPALTMRLDPDAGSIDLTVPRDTIRRITVAAPAPNAQPTETPRAQTH